MFRLPICVVLASTLTGCHRSGSISLLFEEVSDTAAVEDVEVTTDGDQDVSDRNGKATVRGLEEGAYQVVATADGRPTHRFFMSGETGYWEVYYALVTTADVERITSALGVDYDPSLGIVEVNGIWTEGANGLTDMAGLTVSLSATDSVALIPDPGSDLGWKLGDTIPTDAPYSVVVYVNVPVGAFDVSLDLPEEAASCGTFPSNTEDATQSSFTAAAGEISAIMYVCTKAGEADARTVAQRRGLRLDVDPPTRAGGAVQLGGRLDAAAVGRASYTLRATPQDAPTDVQIDVTQPDGHALKLRQRLDLATTQLDVGGGSLSYAALPDGTYALDDRVYDSEPALRRALLADPRLSGLSEPMLLGWISALSDLAEAAPTRIQVISSDGLNRVRMVNTPTQLGCLRFGEDSLPCQLGRATQAQGGG